jgi:hypothetical protein
VAVSEEPSVDPTKPTRRVVVPQELPYAMSVEGLGLREVHPLLSHSVKAVFCAPPPLRSVLKSAAETPFRGLAQRALERALPRPHPVSLPGRVVLDRPGELVVEVALETALDWSPPARAQVVLRNGKRPSVTVDAQRTTAAGLLAPGQVLRIVLRHSSKRVFGVRLRSVVLEVRGAVVEISVAAREAPAGTGDEG